MLCEERKGFSNVCIVQYSHLNKKLGFCEPRHAHMRLGTRVKVETAFSVVNSWLWGWESSGIMRLKDRLESLVPPVGTGIGLRRMQAR